jgi:chemotaxis protein methyltransferase WspC
VSAYWALLLGSGAERQALIDAVVVPETWFFRDPGAFDALLCQALPAWRRDAPLTPLRVLSVPCSTGEEAYSLAIALLEAGLAPSAFRIDAVDISERALGLARAGVYRRNSFRGQALEFRDRHFDARGDEFQLRASVIACVQFRRGNLFDLDPTSTPYDVVFCRNLLIYFDRPTQDLALRRLRQLLKPSGMLFLGPAEAALARAPEWAPIKAPLAFAFRPAPSQAGAVTPAPPVRRSQPSHPRIARRSATKAGSGTPAAPAPSPRSVAPTSVVVSELAQAARLADQGRYPEAAEQCEQMLRRDPSDAGALFLLGVVREALGQSGAAAQCYRKTLYLEPGHPEALHHYALLLERQGDVRGAQMLRDRASRRASADDTRR